ncbi:hypothetical protein [Bdellovibrio sp. BCCA]|uniref:hypothetical protein n=1 Tax=Bdellovibrio sp. BCCA TaxID=3136281 RepID=UPI0030F21312
MKKIKSKNYKYNPNEWDDSKSEKVAKQKGDVGYQTLLKIWIAERLDQELRAKR